MNGCSLLDQYLEDCTACAEEFQLHMQTCESCREAVEQSRTIERVLATADRAVSPDSAWLQRTEAALRGTASSMSATPPTSVERLHAPGAMEPANRAAFFRVIAVAAAAVMIAIAYSVPSRQPDGAQAARESTAGYEEAMEGPGNVASDDVPGVDNATDSYPLVRVVVPGESTQDTEHWVEGGSGFLVADLGATEPEIDILMVLPVLSSESDEQ